MQDVLKTLQKAVNAAVVVAEEPEVWLVLLGSSFWGKTHHRDYAHLPTVITSTLKPISFAVNYSGLWNDINDATKSRMGRYKPTHNHSHHIPAQ